MRNRGNLDIEVLSRTDHVAPEEAKDKLVVDLELEMTRLRAENKILRQTQQEARVAFDQLAFFNRHSPIGYVEFDAKGNMFEVNDAAAKLVGRKREQLLRSPFTHLVKREDLELFLAHLRQCKTSKLDRIPTELHLQKAGGGAVPVQLVSVPFRRDGKDRFLGALIDLTERKQNENALQGAKDFAENIIETVREPLVVLDADLKVVSVNRAFTTSFQKSSPVAVGQLFDVLLNLWWTGNKVRSALERVLQLNVTLDNFELKVEPKGLGKRTFLMNARVLQAQGVSRHILVALQDITEEKEAEERLRQSESMLQEAQRLAHIGSWEWDINEDRLVCTEEFYHIYGINRASFKADFAAFLECVHVDDRPMVNSAILTAYRNRTPFEFSHRTALPQAYRILNCHGYVVCDQIGKPLKLVGTAQDVTEIKEAENRLSRLNEELEQRVLKRTQALQQSNRQMEAFCYSIAHDLRAPLRAMKGFGFALREDYESRLDAQGKEYIDRIVNAADRMDHLIQDLLDYGRLNTVDLPLGEVDAEHMLDDILQHMKQELKTAHATVVRKEKIPALLAHPVPLEMAFANIIGNALKFVAAGTSPKIRIWPEDRGERVRIWIEDNGIGISEQYQQRIFEVFQRLHNNDVYPGTGIGLAIVAKGIDRIGGLVGVESEPGKGSRFWIELPKAQGSTAQ
jgi:PAS domain S-box-containing protein